MKNPLLTVIVPVYNNEKYLSECIDSILAQTYADLEILLIDDGSKDRSAEICDEYMKTDSRIHCIHKKNEGACYARKDGVLAASGEYVTFVDSDDWIDPNMYQELMKEAIINGADIVTSGFVYEQGKKVYTRCDIQTAGMYSAHNKKELLANMIYNDKAQTGGILVSVCTKIYKKSLLQPYLMQLPPNLQLWEDISYVYPAFVKADNIVVLHQAYYHYRQHQESTSHRYDRDEYQKTIYSFENAENVYKDFDETVLEGFYKKSMQVLYQTLWKNLLWKSRNKDRSNIERKKDCRIST